MDARSFTEKYIKGDIELSSLIAVLLDHPWCCHVAKFGIEAAIDENADFGLRKLKAARDFSYRLSGPMLFEDPACQIVCRFALLVAVG